MNKQRVLSTLVLLAATGAAQADINIGVSVSATGPAASLGIPEKNTFAILPTSIGGEKINYIVLDDATDPGQATKNARKLVTEDKVDLLVGSSSTPACAAIAEVANETQTPQVAMCPVDLPAAKNTWVFRAPQHNSLMAKALVGHMKETGVKTLGFIGFNDPVDSPTEEEQRAEGTAELQKSAQVAYDTALAAAQSATIMSSPLSGRVVPLESVPDPVFASGAMGSGVAVDPSAGKVFAPFDGKVVAVLPSKHAVGLISDDGVEVLIHIGIDTVQLKGEHFTCHVDAGQLVSKGDLLIEFDINAIQNAGYSVVTPVIVTNSKKYSDVLPAPATVVKAGEELLAAVTLASAEEEKVSN